MKALLTALLMLTQVTSPQFPQAEISTAGVRATLYLPDPQTGYYRGTRFDWSGVIASLKWNGHDYFGPWFEKYDPKIHDAISGPVEEFLTGKDSALGYAEAAAGGTFVRIGVGVARKPDEPAYRRFGTYDIVDHGKWSVDRGKDWIEIAHVLSDSTGYAYEYRKRIQVTNDGLVLEHRLKNTGRKRIETSVYNHNFFVMDGQRTSPDFKVRFPFAPRAARQLNGLAEVQGSDMAFLRAFDPGQTVFTEIEGFGATAKDYDFRIENRKTGAGVHIVGDRPIFQLYFWSAATTVCPEPYIDVSVDVGKEVTWRIAYTFYQVKGA